MDQKERKQNVKIGGGIASGGHCEDSVKHLRK